MKTNRVLSAIAALMFTSPALACSCASDARLTEEEQIQRAFSEADAVIVAKVVTTEHSLQPEDVSGQYWVEDALFVVLEVLKGSYKAGSSVQIRSLLGGGSCGRSARNDPPWLEVATRPANEGPSNEWPAIVSAAVFSDEWLIYASGDEPYELSNCSRSFPMDLRGGKDAEYIRSKLLQSADEDGI